MLGLGGGGFGGWFFCDIQFYSATFFLLIFCLLRLGWGFCVGCGGLGGFVLWVCGSQWFWWVWGGGGVFLNVLVDSEAELGDIRVLESVTSITLLSGLNVRFLLTSSDVIHSLAIPNIGIKCDALVGRIASFDISTGGADFYGVLLGLWCAGFFVCDIFVVGDGWLDGKFGF